MNVLKQKLKTIIIPNHTFEIEHSWTGIMAFGDDKTLIIEKPSPNVILGVRLNGMGVAIGSQLGEEIATIITQ